MNIREAIHQTEIALRAYLARDERGMPLIPIESQRPIYLLGAPGVGKTAAAEEVARRLDVGLVSYTLTHHTRQSALGLPQIVARTFEGREMAVTEYTTSEIIAGVYRYMEKTGRTRGILFLDEINCVSETLLPGDHGAFAAQALRRAARAGRLDDRLRRQSGEIQPIGASV